MAPFQLAVIALLVVIALLLAALIACGSVLVSRVRHTNSVMRRIEEALISKASVSTQEREPARYLTIRDLKNRPEPKIEIEPIIREEPPAAPVSPARDENEILSASLVRHSPAAEAPPAPTPSDSVFASDDPVARKERDALLFMLNSQRRRRRARQGH